MSDSLSAALEKRILVVDDDEGMRDSIKDSLTRVGYQVLSASDGKSAQELLDNGNFDVVVSDIKMPGMSGIELARLVKKSKGVPVVLMTGFSELAHTKEAAEAGVRHFLAKPFKHEDLVDVIKKCLESHPASGEEAQAEDVRTAEYCRLGIEDFITGHEIKYDIFIRLQNNEYTKIAHHGEDLPLEKLKEYKSKGISFLYLRKDDFLDYMGFNLSLASKVKESKSLSRSQKFQLLKHTGEVILEHLHFHQLDKQAFDGARSLVEMTVELLDERGDALELLGELNSQVDSLYTHSLGVGLYGVMIARQLEWTGSRNLFKIAIGGLLHDIGKKDIDREILMKPRRDWSEAEAKTYEEHPRKGMEILNQVKSIPSDVILIVLQHHESCNGLGFPSHLRKNNIHPMARLIAVADEFCKLALKNPESDGMKPELAIERMYTLFSQTLDPLFFISLAKLFKVRPPNHFPELQVLFDVKAKGKVLAR